MESVNDFAPTSRLAAWSVHIRLGIRLKFEELEEIFRHCRSVRRSLNPEYSGELEPVWPYVTRRASPGPRDAPYCAISENPKIAENERMLTMESPNPITDALLECGVFINAGRYRYSLCIVRIFHADERALSTSPQIS